MGNNGFIITHYGLDQLGDVASAWVIWNLDHHEFIYEFGSTWIHRYEFIVYEFINYEFIVCYEFIDYEFIFMILWIHIYEFKYFRIHSYEFIYVNSIVNSICIIMNSYLWIQVLLNS